MKVPTALGRSLDSLVRNEKIVPLFEELLLKGNWPEEYPVKVYNKERKWDGFFHPSSHTRVAPLKLYYEFSKEHRGGFIKEKNSPQLEMTYQVGSVFHALFESVFIHIGLTTKEECEVQFVDEDHLVSGTVDIRKLTLPSGEELLVDIKSCSIIPNMPEVQYVEQLRCYLDFCPGAPSTGALFFVEKGHPHRVREFIIEKNEDEQIQVYRRWDSVLEALEFRDPSSLPTCCDGPGSSMFENCPAKLVCERWNS